MTPPSPHPAAVRATAVRRVVRLPALVLLLPLVATTVGCASTLRPAAASTEVQDDLREIKQRLVEIQRQGAMTRVQVEELERRLQVLEARAGIRSPTSSRGSTGGRPRDTVAQDREAEARNERLREALRRDPAPATPRSDVREERPPEPIEPSSAGVEGSDISIDDMGDDGYGEPPSAIRPPADRAPASGPGSTADDAPVAAGAPISAAAQAVYDRGYTLYHQGSYIDSEAAFQRFLQLYSDTDLADNAQYWIGEARFARGDVPGSLAAFREVVARYPEGNKVPDALLKAGQALEQLGDRENARRTYRELMDGFPNSAAAVRARERLAALP